jgi:hypothetical protein
VYRRILGNKNAGKPGHVPFPTFLKYSMSPRSLERFAQQNQLTLEYLELYEEKVQVRVKKKHWIFNFAYTVLGPLLKLASFGYIDPDITDFTMVLRKPSNKTLSAARSAEMVPQA